MKIALFTAPITSYETKRFFISAKENGHSLDVIPFQSLIFEIARNGKIQIKVGGNTKRYLGECEIEGVRFPEIKQNHNLSQYDAVIPRGALRKGEPERAKLKILLYKYYSDLGIPVLNGDSQLVKADNKLWQHFQFAKFKVPVVPTKFVASASLLGEATKNMHYPLFVKEERGSHGVKASAPKNLSELEEIYKKIDRPAYLLIQKHFQTRSDIRIIVVGQKILGGMKRTARKGSIVSNYSAGGSISETDLSNEEKEIALKSARALGADYGGADLMRDKKGNIYVLEFNRNASFKGFEKSTGVDVPKEVFDYLATKNKP